jgi:hypothetical protein
MVQECVELYFHTFINLHDKHRDIRLQSQTGLQALENIDDNVDINRVWESIRENTRT